MKLRCNATTFTKDKIQSNGNFCLLSQNWKDQNFHKSSSLVKANFDFVMFGKMEVSGGSIFLKWQLWNFLSSVFMPSLRRPAVASI